MQRPVPRVTPVADATAAPRVPAANGGRYAYVYYLVAYERQPIKVEFHFFRPKDKWVLLNFQLNAEVSADAAALALRDRVERVP